ncbi:MAG: DAK2 domain-containing protein, partial [Gaiellales bacterium]
MPNPPTPSLLALAVGARARLAAERAQLDAINVYPVADGDTGSNMLATADAVVAALRAQPADPAGAVADAALLGARGNSGTILSALVRAAAQRLGPAPDGPAVAAALAAGAEAAYAAVPEPVEGTMLTVARAAAEASTGE